MHQRVWQCTEVWVTTSTVKCDRSPSCEIQEICDKMEMEEGMSGCQVRGIPKRARSSYQTQSVTEKKNKLKGMNMCNELCLSLVSISFVLFSVNKVFVSVVM